MVMTASARALTLAALLLVSPRLLADSPPAPAMPQVISPAQADAAEAVMKKHMATLEPQMKAMAKDMAKNMDTPENRAAMEKMAKEMQGLAARQLPVMMKAMQPMMAEMLPQLLRMQADMLQAMFAKDVPAPKAE